MTLETNAVRPAAVQQRNDSSAHERIFSSRHRRFTFPVALFSAVLAIFLALFSGQARADDDFLDPEEAFRYSAALSSPTTLDIHYRIAPEYYMYRERFELGAPEGVIRDASYPPGLVKYDPTFEKDMEVYYGQVTVRVQLPSKAPIQGAAPIEFSITSQGCADAGLCYPPETRTLNLGWSKTEGWSLQGPGVVKTVPAPLTYVIGKDGRPASGNQSAGAANAASNPFELGDTGLAAWLQDAGWFQIVGLCLVLGLMLAFTPCVLPMVPILMAIIAGDREKAVHLSKGRGLSLAAVFVLGMSIVYTVLGVFAGLLGSGLMIWLQTPWVLTSFAILLAVLALAMFDVFTLQVPASLQSTLNERINRIPGGHYSGVFFMGMLSALIVGPCVAAPLAGVLLFISQTGDVALGGTALFALAWGSGIPLLLLGVSSGALLPRAGAWMEGVKWAFGILLLATAWWMVTSLLPAWIVMLGWIALLSCSAVMLGAFTALPAKAGVGRYLLKAIGLLLAAWALLMLVGLAGGGRDPLRPLAIYTAQFGQSGAPAAAGGATGATDAAGLAEAVKRRFVTIESMGELDDILAQADRPVMLDFYADWCVSCIEMERYTFSDRDVARKLDSFVLVQADVTGNKAEHRELLKRFRLFGPPGIIFFDAQGKELDIRVVGFQNAERFGQSLDQVLALPEKAPASGASMNSALLSQQLRGFNREVGQNAIGAGPLEAQK